MFMQKKGTVPSHKKLHIHSDVASREQKPSKNIFQSTKIIFFTFSFFSFQRTKIILNPCWSIRFCTRSR